MAHKDLLMAKSIYFKNCFGNQNWKEAQKNEVHWNESYDTPEAVEVMMDWLYRRTLTLRSLSGEASMNLSFAARCYKLAHSKGMIAFMNAITDAVRKAMAQEGMFMSLPGLNECQRLGIKDTPLYDCLFAKTVWVYSTRFSMLDGNKFRGKTFRERLTDGSKELIVDLLEACLRFVIKPHDDPVVKVGCHYHDHSDGTSCGTSAT